MDKDRIIEVLEDSLNPHNSLNQVFVKSSFEKLRDEAIRGAIDEITYLTNKLAYAREEIELLNQHKENAEKEIARLMSQTENELNRAEVIRRPRGVEE